MQEPKTVVKKIVVASAFALTVAVAGISIILNEGNEPNVEAALIVTSQQHMQSAPTATTAAPATPTATAADPTATATVPTHTPERQTPTQGVGNNTFTALQPHIQNVEQQRVRGGRNPSGPGLPTPTSNKMLSCEEQYRPPIDFPGLSWTIDPTKGGTMSQEWGTRWYRPNPVLCEDPLRPDSQYPTGYLVFRVVLPTGVREATVTAFGTSRNGGTLVNIREGRGMSGTVLVLQPRLW